MSAVSCLPHEELSKVRGDADRFTVKNNLKQLCNSRIQAKANKFAEIRRHKLSITNGGKNFVFNINNTCQFLCCLLERLSQVIVGEKSVKQIRFEVKAISYEKVNEK